MTTFRTATASLLDLAAGRRCLTCSVPGTSWCESCLARAVDRHRRVTQRGLVVLAGAHYRGDVQAAVIAHKESGYLALVGPLSRLLARPELSGSLLVPVPSTRATVRARGHDHSRRLAGAVATVVDADVVPALRWRRQVADQSALSVSRRRENVAGSMVARTPRRGRRASAPVWIIDDVMTSGATVDEAARALVVSGWQVAGAAVVATVDSRRALADAAPLR